MHRIAQCFEYGIVPLYDEKGKLANCGCHVSLIVTKNSKKIYVSKK
jgi:hypothetical protein